MFLPNKYTKWYQELMAKRRADPAPKGESERHHEVPRSFDGPNTKDNIVRLTIREHVIAHAMLVRMTSGPNHFKMARALGRMLSGRQGSLYTPRSSVFAASLRKASRAKMSDEQKARVSAAHKGKVISEKQKLKLSAALKGKKQKQPTWTEERKRARSEAMSGVPQGPHSEETRRKIGDTHRGKVISDEQKLKLSIAQSAAMKKRWAEKKARASAV